MRKPELSGHCRFPQHKDFNGGPEESHQRCIDGGEGNRANPAKEFQPCPCGCHLGEEFSCGACGRPIREAPHFEGDEWDENGVPYMRYIHIDPVSGNGTTEECTR